MAKTWTRSSPISKHRYIFLQAGECDLFFYKRNIGYHVIDRALKFSGGMVVKDRLAETVLDAYVDSWVSRYGAFEQLYSDGGLGLNNTSTINALRRLGTELKVRAPEQHARLAEVRQAMLRHVMHLTEEIKKGTIVQFPSPDYMEKPYLW